AEAERAIHAVCIVGTEGPAGDEGEVRVLEREAHHGATEAETARRWLDKDVHDVRKARPVGGDAQAAALLARTVRADHERRVPEAVLDVCARNADGPVSAGQPGLAAGKVDALERVVDLVVAVGCSHGAHLNSSAASGQRASDSVPQYLSNPVTQWLCPSERALR